MPYNLRADGQIDQANKVSADKYVKSLAFTKM